MKEHVRKGHKRQHLHGHPSCSVGFVRVQLVGWLFLFPVSQKSKTCDGLMWLYFNNSHLMLLSSQQSICHQCWIKPVGRHSRLRCLAISINHYACLNRFSLLSLSCPNEQRFNSSWMNWLISKSHFYLFCLMHFLGCYIRMKGASTWELSAGQPRLTAPQCQGRDWNYCKEKHNWSNVICDSA